MNEAAKAEVKETYELFKEYAVKDCDDLKSFLEKYYKHERYQGRGEEYADNLFRSHRMDLLRYGCDWISHHESVTGKIVSFYPKREAAK